MNERAILLGKQLKNRVLVLDGATGTAIQNANLTAEDFGGPLLEGCNENLVLTRPDIIRSIHASYLEVGADIIQTNTFGSTDLVLAEFGLESMADEITEKAARLAREVAEEFSSSERPRFVAGAMGPTTKAISVTGGISFDELSRTFGRQAQALITGGADYLLLETCQDTRNIKAGLQGIRKAFLDLGTVVPIAVSVTIEPMGAMLAGQNIESLVTSLSHVPLLYLGLNCATGPDFMSDHIRALSELAQTRVACVPNAGLPDEDGNYLETPEMMAVVLKRFLSERWLNLLGGCCGTTPEHIRTLAELSKGVQPRKIPQYQRTFLSGIENLEIEDSMRPGLVGERTNVLGSRLFKRLIREEKLEEATDIGRRQVKKGAHIIDICLQDPDRDEKSDMEAFLELFIKKVKVPLMIDTTDAAVMETALTYCQGKSVLNSINLEDGEARFARVVPLVKSFGAAVVVGTIDDDREQGMAVTRERKLEIARRSYDLLVGKYGLSPSDLIFDPLVFPCATGDKNYLGSARETIEGVRLIKEELPHCKTILGISNVSFGLPPAGREVMNSVFLYHCTKAGLDLAIVNTEKLERYPTIPENEKQLAEAVLFEPGDKSIARFVEHFRDASSRIRQDVSKLSLDQRLANYIIEGSKDGLVQDLEAKREEAEPLDIINGPLMQGMDEVGRLFNGNQLIVAEVLQSAEAMKAAVAHLEQFMDKQDSATKGRVLLATVKGDVHDIGKNLVEIILSNNGYKVINLGIKVPPHDLIDGIRTHKPDIVGLSGLLVKSAQQMIITANELSEAGLCPPLMVGGAALTRSFVRLKIAPEYDGTVVYASDAMHGLELAGRLLDSSEAETLQDELQREQEMFTRKREKRRKPDPLHRRRRFHVSPAKDLPQPSDFGRHVLRDIRLDEVWPYINPSMLYGKHMGLKGRVRQRLAEGDSKASQLQQLFENLKEECRQGMMSVHAVWQFFPAVRRSDSVVLLDPDSGTELAQFDFPRGPSGLCLSDFVSDRETSPRDSIGLFAVTAGGGIRETYSEFKEAGEFLKSHAIQALAVETAEATAEWLHNKLRGLWGFPDPPETAIGEKLRANYRGKRYSFGYPACPNLSDQVKLWKLLKPGEIGIELTEDHMMEPEASVSAVVLHHPEARYFSALEDE